MNDAPKDINGKILNHLNIVTGKDIKIKELAKKISKIINYEGEIKWDQSKPDGTPKKLLDVRRINKLGWKANIDLDEGIQRTIKNLDLSSFYFDIRKDSLYCDSLNSNTRKSTRTVLDILFNYLVRWFSPILCFTCEEVMQSRFPDNSESVHELEFLSADNEWLNNELFEKWEKIRSVRRVVTGAIELERKEKRIGSSLEAFPNVFISNKEYLEIFRNIDLA